MNNFLYHLAERSVAHTDVIMPRPSSLFEAAISPIEPINLEEETFAEPRQPETPSPPASIDQAVPQPGIDVEAPATTATPPPSNPEQITPKSPPLPEWLYQLKSLIQQPNSIHSETALPAIEVKHPVAPNIDPQKASTPEPITPIMQAPSQNQAETPSSMPPSHEQVIEHRQTETRLVVERLEQQPQISETMIERNLYSPVEQADAPQPIESSVIEPMTDKQKVIVTETRPYTPPVPPLSIEEQQVEQTPPTIHVTIGRVDVRATTQPSTTPKKRPQPSRSPIMSLDEYLKQRSNGDKR